MRAVRAAHVARGLGAFELVTLVMIGSRTAIDLTHTGPTEENMRLSVLVTGSYTLLALAWLISRWMGGRRPHMSPIVIAAAAVTGAAILSASLSTDPVQALTGASRWFSLAVFLLVLENVVIDERSARRLLVAVAISTVIPLSLGAWQFGTGTGRLLDGIWRIEGSFAHPNTYGFYLAIVGIALVAILRHLTFGYRLVGLGLLLLVIASLIATYSRTSYIAFATGVLIVAVLGRRWALLAAVVVALAVAPLVAIVGDRFSDLSAGSTLRGTPGNSLTWRIAYWGDVIEAGEGRRVTGLGLGMVSETTEQGREPHNDFVRVFVELGGIGLVCYLGFLASLGWQLRRALLSTRSASALSRLPRGMAEASAGILVAYSVASLTGNPMTQLVLLWYTFGLFAAGSWPARSGSAPAISERDRPKARLVRA